MSDEPIVAAPAPDAAPAADAKPEVVADKVVVEEKIGEVLKDEQPPAPQPRMVPEAAFLGEKKGRKEAERALEALKARIEAGGTPAETTASIDELATKHNIDPVFLRDFAGAIRQDAKAEADATFKELLKPIEEGTKKERIEKIFATHFDKTMAEMPEYAKVVNRDVVKALSMLPENANKTFAQLIESTYGAAVGGKRTFETGTTPRADRDTGKVDMARAQTDGAYFAEIMADPAKKAEYNAGLTDRIGSSL